MGHDDQVSGWDSTTQQNETQWDTSLFEMHPKQFTQNRNMKGN